MNKARRKKISEIAGQLSDLRDQLQDVLEEEEEYRDSIPENLQTSERYEKSDEACEILDTCGESLEEVFTQLQEIAES